MAPRIPSQAAQEPTQPRAQSPIKETNAIANDRGQLHPPGNEPAHADVAVAEEPAVRNSLAKDEARLRNGAIQEEIPEDSRPEAPEQDDSLQAEAVLSEDGAVTTPLACPKEDFHGLMPDGIQELFDAGALSLSALASCLCT